MKYIVISHPKLGKSEIMPTSLRVWEERGWSEVKDPKGTAREAAKKQAAAAQSPEATASGKTGDSTGPAESKK